MENVVILRAPTRQMSLLKEIIMREMSGAVLSGTGYLFCIAALVMCRIVYSAAT